MFLSHTDVSPSLLLSLKLGTASQVRKPGAAGAPDPRRVTGNRAAEVVERCCLWLVQGAGALAKQSQALQRPCEETGAGAGGKK